MTPASFDNLITQKFSILDTAPDVFSDSAKAIQKRLLTETLKILKKFDTNGGSIDPKSISNTKLLLLLNKRLKVALKAMPWKSVTSKFLKSFDDVETNSLRLLKGVNALSSKEVRGLKLGADKLLAIEELSDSLLRPSTRFTNVGKPIRKILFRHVTTGINIADAEREIRQFIIKDKGKLGFLEKHVRQLTQDSLSQYDGTIQQKAVKEFGLDGFRYIHPLITTSRDFCVHMVSGTGFAAGLSVNGIYRTKDLPTIIRNGERLKNGWIEGTNVSNFFVNRGGYNCRHAVIATRIRKKKKKTEKRTDSFEQNILKS